MGLGNKEIMAKNINRLMALNQKSRRDICSDLNFKYTTFTDWVNGVKYPRIDKIEKMANYFHVEKSDLIEDKTESCKLETVHNVVVTVDASREVIRLTPEEIEHIKKRRQATEDARKTADSVLDLQQISTKSDKKVTPFA